MIYLLFNLVPSVRRSGWLDFFIDQAIEFTYMFTTNIVSLTLYANMSKFVIFTTIHMKKDIEKSLKTTKFTRTEDVKHGWYLVDANGKTLGRLASSVAKIIRGKNKPQFTPNTDTGDFVVVVNAEKVKMTGKREQLKKYLHHSLYPGGQKSVSFKELIAKKPERVIEMAVQGMLPKSNLGRSLRSKLKIYAGEKHPHIAQNPKTIIL